MLQQQQYEIWWLYENIMMGGSRRFSKNIRLSCFSYLAASKVNVFLCVIVIKMGDVRCCSTNTVLIWPLISHWVLISLFVCTSFLLNVHNYMCIFTESSHMPIQSNICYVSLSVFMSVFDIVLKGKRVHPGHYLLQIFFILNFFLLEEGHNLANISS